MKLYHAVLASVILVSLFIYPFFDKTINSVGWILILTSILICLAYLLYYIRRVNRSRKH